MYIPQLITQEYSKSNPLRVVIVGGGFAGLKVVFTLNKAMVDENMTISLIDPKQFMEYTPSIISQMNSNLSSYDITVFYESLLKDFPSTRHIQGFATQILESSVVVTRTSHPHNASLNSNLSVDSVNIPFDVLYLTHGSSYSAPIKSPQSHPSNSSLNTVLSLLSPIDLVPTSPTALHRFLLTLPSSQRLFAFLYQYAPFQNTQDIHCLSVPSRQVGVQAFKQALLYRRDERSTQQIDTERAIKMGYLELDMEHLPPLEDECYEDTTTSNNNTSDHNASHLDKDGHLKNDNVTHCISKRYSEGSTDNYTEDVLTIRDSEPDTDVSTADSSPSLTSSQTPLPSTPSLSTIRRLVVIGGGLVGVEMAAEAAVLMQTHGVRVGEGEGKGRVVNAKESTLDYPYSIHDNRYSPSPPLSPSSSPSLPPLSIELHTNMSTILPGMPEGIIKYATRRLTEMGVTIVAHSEVSLDTASDHGVMVCVCAGLQPSSIHNPNLPLSHTLPSSSTPTSSSTLPSSSVNTVSNSTKSDDGEYTSQNHCVERELNVDLDKHNYVLVDESMLTVKSHTDLFKWITSTTSSSSTSFPFPPLVLSAGDVCNNFEGGKMAMVAETQATLAVVNTINILLHKQHLSDSLHSGSSPPSPPSLSLLNYPDTPFGGTPPLISCVSLGPYDGVVVFNGLWFSGRLAAWAKKGIEFTKIREYRNMGMYSYLWHVCDQTAIVINQMYRSVSRCFNRDHTKTNKDKND